MRIRIISFRGDHAADVETPVARAIFEKMMGRNKEPLPDEFKAKVPDTFQELTALWKKGNPGYTAAHFQRIKTPDGEEVKAAIVTEFDDQLEDLFFMPQVAGG